MALPEISFVETDTGNIESAIITTYEALAGRTLAQGDPIRLFLLSIAAIIVQQRVLIDYSAKMKPPGLCRGGLSGPYRGAGRSQTPNGCSGVNNASV